MADLETLSQEYAERIKGSPDPRSEVLRIIREIRQLTYTYSGQSISIQDKERLARGIYKHLTWDPVSKKSIDNQNYLDLVNYILSQL